MKKTLLASFVSAASAAAALAADPDPAQLQAFPKNLARQHLGANLFQYSATSQNYSPTQASAAWLDDDISTGWAMLNGKQYYLLALPEAESLENFSLSARPAAGTVSIYAGDQVAPPEAKSWTPLAKDVPFDSLNEKKTKVQAKTARYVLIETNLTDAGAVYSLYMYGNKPAASYEVARREQPINTTSIFGPYANESTAFSVTSLYAKSYVNPQEGQAFGEVQNAIDDNPETSTTLGGTKPASLEIRSTETHSISRVALEVNPGAKGRFEFFLKNSDTPAGNDGTPAGTITLDGTKARASVDFPAAQATVVVARWTPANGTDAVSVREVNAFGSGFTLASNTVTTSAGLDPIAAAPEGDADGNPRKVARARSSRDAGKDYKDAKDGKEAEPIAALDRQTGPFLPGALGFPPNPTLRRVVLPPASLSP